jgi:uncharacterized glyoxalase superfamily protein PhnB
MGDDGRTRPATVRFELFTYDTAEIQRFLEEALGFSAARTTDDYVHMVLGHAEIGLGKLDGLPPSHPLKPGDRAERRGLGVELVIETDDVDAAYERAKTTGFPIDTPLGARPWGLRDFRMVAPGGYYFRITSR